jgi:hypothetical protein
MAKRFFKLKKLTISILIRNRLWIVSGIQLSNTLSIGPPGHMATDNQIFYEDYCDGAINCKLCCMAMNKAYAASD